MTTEKTRRATTVHSRRDIPTRFEPASGIGPLDLQNLVKCRISKLRQKLRGASGAHTLPCLLRLDRNYPQRRITDIVALVRLSQPPRNLVGLQRRRLYAPVWQHMFKLCATQTHHHTIVMRVLWLPIVRRDSNVVDAAELVFENHFVIRRQACLVP